MDRPPDGRGFQPGVASKWEARLVRVTTMTIEELLAKALYSERERRLAERRLLLEAERARRRVPEGQTPGISRLSRPGRDRTTHQRRAA